MQRPGAPAVARGQWQHIDKPAALRADDRNRAAVVRGGIAVLGGEKRLAQRTLGVGRRRGQGSLPLDDQPALIEDEPSRLIGEDKASIGTDQEDRGRHTVERLGQHRLSRLALIEQPPNRHGSLEMRHDQRKAAPIVWIGEAVLFMQPDADDR
ncbi:hypothetical protein [Bradyrhizobium sp. S3.2.6]|uniref:hypothetical protein n=1 Tax=unclassified Bradyrhizobium TaxID=2631580 RepID=UPI00339568C2